jgi:hypothetical protein
MISMSIPRRLSARILEDSSICLDELPKGVLLIDHVTWDVFVSAKESHHLQGFVVYQAQGLHREVEQNTLEDGGWEAKEAL